MAALTNLEKWNRSRQIASKAGAAVLAAPGSTIDDLTSSDSVRAVVREIDSEYGDVVFSSVREVVAVVCENAAVDGDRESLTPDEVNAVAGAVQPFFDRDSGDFNTSTGDMESSSRAFHERVDVDAVAARHGVDRVVVEVAVDLMRCYLIRDGTRYSDVREKYDVVFPRNQRVLTDVLNVDGSSEAAKLNNIVKYVDDWFGDADRVDEMTSRTVKPMGL